MRRFVLFLVRCSHESPHLPSSYTLKLVFHITLHFGIKAGVPTTGITIYALDLLVGSGVPATGNDTYYMKFYPPPPLIHKLFTIFNYFFIKLLIFFIISIRN